MKDLASDSARLRLLQLVSPALPIGGFSWSDGLEAAVAAGAVTTEKQTLHWVVGRLQAGIQSMDLPVLLRLWAAWAAADAEGVARWSMLAAASRETKELRASDEAMGRALARLLDDLGVEGAQPWRRHRDCGLLTMFALAAVRWGISSKDAAQGLAWAWLDNQVTAAVKLVPLGQTAGQRILAAAAPTVIAAVHHAGQAADEDIGQSLPGLAILSANHEAQRVRLFRS